MRESVARPSPADTVTGSVRLTANRRGTVPQPSAAGAGPPGRRDAAAAAALAAVTFVVFLRALACGFINFDDRDYVTENRYVTSGLTLDGARWAFTTYAPVYWQPLAWLSLQLDASLWWPNPRGFLLTNVLLHAANAGLLFLSLRTLTGAYWRSAAAALLFAVHPLRVESVAWVTERKDVLSSCFGLLALWAYAAYADRPSPRRYLGVVGAYTLSLMAKPMLVTLPCILLMLDWWPLGRLLPVRRPGRAAWLPVLEKLPLAVLAAASCALTILSRRATGPWPGLQGLCLAGGFENATVGYATYLVKTIWPAGLAIYYPHPLMGYNKADHLPVVQVAGAALLLAAVTCVAVVVRKRAPYWLAGWVWYLVALLPVIGLVQSGPQAYADRFTYFPQIGILVAVCWAVADLAAKHTRVAAGAAVALGTALALATWNQLSYWRDAETVWRHALRVTGPNPIALQNLAEYLPDDEAVAYLRAAIALDPDGADAAVNADAHGMLGNIYLRARRLDDAAREQEEAIRINPKSGGAYGSLGLVEMQRGRYDRAAERFDEQLRLWNNAAARCNLGAALKYQGRFADAEREWREAVRLDPLYASPHVNLGVLFHRQNRLEEAAREEQKAIELAPRTYEAHFELGLIEIDRGDYGRAIDCLRTALQLRPGSSDALGALGAVLLQLGRLDEALPVMIDVVRGRPQDGAARFNLGRALEERGDLDAAASQYEAATRLGPELAQAWYDLGRLRARQGRHGEAVASFEQAAARDPGSERYRMALDDARGSHAHSGNGGGGSGPR
jgi:tetratricopeptide (TPR) repeat protein